MRRRLVWSSLALVPALGVALAVSPASAGTTHAPASLNARAAAAALAALKRLPLGHMNNQRAPGHTRQIRGLNQAGSFNWAGYVDDNSAKNTYSKVTGRWTEPAVTCGQEDQIVIFFVGLDGWNSGTVEQAGTFAQCYQGKAHYYSWWEMYPATSITIVGSTVAAGDKIAASVVKSGTSFTLGVTDSTNTANSFTKTQTCAATTCLAASADWIAEAPSGARGDYPLPDFKTWTLWDATVTSGTKAGKISTFPDDEITMFDSSATYPLVQPGALNATGGAFTDTWKNSY
jgi:hypothetical protein